MIAILALLLAGVAQQGWKSWDASKNPLNYGDELGAAIEGGNAFLRAAGLAVLWLVLAAIHWL